MKEKMFLTKIPGIGKHRESLLISAGYTTIKSVATAPVQKISALLRCGHDNAYSIVLEAQKIANVKGNNGTVNKPGDSSEHHPDATPFDTLNLCSKDICEQLINGKLEPLQAMWAYKRSFIEIFKPIYGGVGVLHLESLFYSKFASYVSLFNLKFLAEFSGNRKNTPVDIDSYFDTLQSSIISSYKDVITKWADDAKESREEQEESFRKTTERLRNLTDRIVTDNESKKQSN